MAKRYRRYRRSSEIEEGEALAVTYLFFLVVGFITKYWIYILCVMALCLIIFLIYRYKDKIKTTLTNTYRSIYLRKVKKYGKLYSAIQTVNNKYHFYDLKPLYFSYTVRFKSNLKDANIDDYLLMSINDDYERIEKYKKLYFDYLTNYVNYKKEYESLKTLVTKEEAQQLHMSLAKYIKKQKYLYQSFRIKKYYDFNIVVYLNYSSPKGKVKEARHKSYRYPEYKKIYDEYQNLKHTKALYTINSRIERAKMSNSIRHDVLKRDSFKCCYCGRTAADGARLEVDHIIPVSKGGKTEMNNLQTLCDRCNSGKSNKL